MLLATACHDSPTQPGGETQSIAVSGTIRLPDGAPAGGARVSFRSAEYLQGTGTVPSPASRDTLTDSAGAYAVAGLPAGEYAVEISLGDTLGFFRRVTPSPGRANRVEGALALMGGVRGFIALPDTAIIPFHVQAYGLARRIEVKPSGSFTFPLAAGEYTLRLVSESSLHDPLEIPRIVMAAGHDTLLEEFDSAAMLRGQPAIDSAMP